mmetsp:Transcript_21039/g.47695  ORF Transcript_21039/g.47695 Transcript_21039/m.47695 type:complete len:356 (-) Transcript_21039:482-1549(-)
MAPHRQATRRLILPRSLVYILTHGLVFFWQENASSICHAFIVRHRHTLSSSSALNLAKAKKKKDFVISENLAEWAASDEKSQKSSSSPENTMDRRTRRQMDKEAKKRKKDSDKRYNEMIRDTPEASRAVDRLLLALGIDPLEKKDDESDGSSEKSKFPTSSSKKTFDLSSILRSVSDLRAIESAGNLRRVLLGPQGGTASQSYRLAWAGSDDAVCHLGSGLHKVPLARLQEVFLVLGNRNKIQLEEVIRIIGPFPNVKNMLLGDCTTSSDGSAKVSYTSIVDGTGKEILNDGEPRTVDLDVLYAGRDAFVCAVPNGEAKGENADESAQYGERGEQILVFVREDNMTTALEKLRVA